MSTSPTQSSDPVWLQPLQSLYMLPLSISLYVCQPRCFWKALIPWCLLSPLVLCNLSYSSAAKFFMFWGEVWWINPIYVWVLQSFSDAAGYSARVFCVSFHLKRKLFWWWLHKTPIFGLSKVLFEVILLLCSLTKWLFLVSARVHGLSSFRFLANWAVSVMDSTHVTTITFMPPSHEHIMQLSNCCSWKDWEMINAYVSLMLVCWVHSSTMNTWSSLLMEWRL